MESKCIQPHGSEQKHDEKTVVTKNRRERVIEYFSSVEPIVHFAEVVTTLGLTLVLGVTSCVQGQRQEELLARQIQIEDAAADPPFACISSQMMGRDSPDLFALYKPAGTVLDLHVDPYDSVVLRINADSILGIENPVADFEVRVRGRFETDASIDDGVYIAVHASQEYEPLETALTVLMKDLENAGMRVEVMTPLRSTSVLQMRYRKQTGEVASEAFVLDATTGRQVE